MLALFSPARGTSVLLAAVREVDTRAELHGPFSGFIALTCSENLVLHYCSFNAVQCMGLVALDCCLHFSCWIIFHVSSVQEQGGFSGGMLLGSALCG